jgi:hypothetical protein
VYRPSDGKAVVLELEPVAITNVDGGCARAATFGEGKVGAVKIVDGGGASRRS